MIIPSFKASPSIPHTELFSTAQNAHGDDPTAEHRRLPHTLREYVYPSLCATRGCPQSGERSNLASEAGSVHFPHSEVSGHDGNKSAEDDILHRTISSRRLVSERAGDITELVVALLWVNNVYFIALLLLSDELARFAPRPTYRGTMNSF